VTEKSPTSIEQNLHQSMEISPPSNATDHQRGRNDGYIYSKVLFLPVAIDVSECLLLQEGLITEKSSTNTQS
jgi:hypothetical protein